MKKYKVEFIETRTYVVDVEAENEKEATDKATERFVYLTKKNIEHLYEINDVNTAVGTVYDVTNTDDPFNP